MKKVTKRVGQSFTGSTARKQRVVTPRQKVRPKQATAVVANNAVEPVFAPSELVTLEESVKRRRYIDPTTCERDYSAAEVEFMNALDAYKRNSGRMFPTCSEILEVIRKLGYEKAEEKSVESVGV